MAFPYKRILNPVDFDENSTEAVEVAAEFARQNDGTVILLHVIPACPIPRAPLDDTTGGLPTYTIAEDEAGAKLEETARKHLQGIENQLLICLGDPAAAIIGAAADLWRMSSLWRRTGTRGFSRAFFGSIAEEVLREAPCPVLTLQRRCSIISRSSDIEIRGETICSCPTKLFGTIRRRRSHYSLAHCSQQFSSVV